MFQRYKFPSYYTSVQQYAQWKYEALQYNLQFI